MRLLAAVLSAALLLLATPARAEVAAASSSAFLLRFEADIAKSPDQVWRDFQRIDRWWNEAHTYSGDAANLRLDARAGGCWCERWGNRQSVEHARVVLVSENDGVRTLRAIGGFGPLQEMGVTGVLTVTVATHPNGAKLILTYRVSGDPSLNLAALAPAVDSVLLEQFDRLTHYSLGTLD